MRVGIYNVDSRAVPNLALLRLTGYHLRRGDTVEPYAPLLATTYDRVYASKVFRYSDGSQLDPDAMVIGGTGWDASVTLPPEVEAAPPDYSLTDYPHSIGFTMRGCRFRCGFCVVPKKEGRPRPTNTIADIWCQRDSRLVVLLDNDFFGNPEWRDRIEEIRRLDLLVSFSQGLNIRIITDEQASALASVKFRNMKGTRKQVHFAWDRVRDERLVMAGIDRVLAAGIKPHQMAFFVLVGFDTTEEQDLRRIHALRARGCEPFVMPYDRRNPYQAALARWANHKAIAKSVPWPEYRSGVKRRPLPVAGQGDLFGACERHPSDPAATLEA